jgi:hypothetical protein
LAIVLRIEQVRVRSRGHRERALQPRACSHLEGLPLAPVLLHHRRERLRVDSGLAQTDEHGQRAVVEHGVQDLALHLAQDRHRLLGARPPPAAPRRRAAEAAAEAARTGPLKFEEGT